jgi:hypothetical protein
MLTGPASSDAAYMFGFSGATGGAVIANPVLGVLTTSGLFNINAHETGWYDTTNSHTPTNPNYYTCTVTGCDTSAANDFFVFRLGTITGTFLDATLTVYNPGAIPDGNNGYSGPAQGLVMTLWDFTGSINDLVAGTAGPGTYTDLGSGIQYASRLVGPADNGTNVVFNLNANALTAIQAALNSNQGPGLFVIGGTLADEAVPEPGTWALMGAGLAGLAFLRRRRAN